MLVSMFKNSCATPALTVHRMGAGDFGPTGASVRFHAEKDSTTGLECVTTRRPCMAVVHVRDLIQKNFLAIQEYHALFTDSGVLGKSGAFVLFLVDLARNAELGHVRILLLIMAEMIASVNSNS